MPPAQKCRAMAQKPPAESQGFWLRNGRVVYFSEVETVEKVLFRLVPRAWTVAMIATAMPAAMRPYSIAVAPVSSARKHKTSVVMMGSSVLTGTVVATAGWGGFNLFD